LPRRDRSRPDHRRIVIAQEAARIMQEQGLTDFRNAKEKAMLRLGLEQQGALPSNEEVELALAERNRIFRGDAHAQFVGTLRRAALQLMRLLDRFQPRLVGSALNGNATEHSTIDLHLFSDAAEDVSQALQTLGIPHRAAEHRMRMRRDEVETYPGYRLRNGDFDFALTVFPERIRRHAPLSPVDGRPMQRAAAKQIEALLADQ
jgi:hypothetical protein